MDSYKKLLTTTYKVRSPESSNNNNDIGYVRAFLYYNTYAFPPLIVIVVFRLYNIMC